MSKRTGSGLLLPVLVVVGLVAVFGVNAVIDFVDGILTGDPVIVGTGETAIMVGPDASAKVEQCTAERVTQDKQCDDLKVVVFDAAKMPFITRNVSLAWREGHESVLTKDSALQDVNRSKACPRKFKKTYPKSSCDEYPFASTEEGGEGARTEEVHKDEQYCQGGTLSTSYRYQHIQDGDRFLVVIWHPDKIGTKPWQGEEVKVGFQC